MALGLQNIAVGAIAQWLVKPALGLLIASTVVRAMQLPQAVATGIILVSGNIQDAVLF